MSSTISTDLQGHALELGQRARVAARILALASTAVKDRWLARLAESLRGRADELLAANQRDLDAAPGYGLSGAQTDRLRLDSKRIEAMARGVEDVRELPDPVGEVMESTTRPNGLEIDKVRVPLGVVFFIYESRPNVTTDAAALCIKSGNAVILRGGKEAAHTNQAIHALIAQSLEQCGLPPDGAQMIAVPDRELVSHLLRLDQYINLVIPRGGESLIRRVAAEARMPVMKHYQGICHVYVHEQADLAMARSIVLNAKCQRPGMCNAAESLLVDRAVADRFLPGMISELQQAGVEVRGCPETQGLACGVVPATEQDFATEYLDLKLSVRVVNNLDEAVEHIARYGSAHTDAIVTRDAGAAREFTRRVDSSAVMVNASTRFNDGGEFGLGAEIGISTDKYHARGPCGLRELTSYKYVVHGDGHVRT
jgi:glutamate-5-semialdehyde dehydrogenase